MFRELLNIAGVWTGHGVEDTCMADIMSKAVTEQDKEDHNFPESRVTYELPDSMCRTRLEEFKASHQRPFRWGWKYHTCHWVLGTLLEIFPGGKFINIRRDRDGWLQSSKKMTSLPDDRLLKAYKLIQESVERFVDHPRVLTLQYEEFLEQPRHAISIITEFIGLEFPVGIEDWIRPEGAVNWIGSN